ncbi:hypothetical protein FRC04_008216 [Tulasnella sp. 424]|nr:hypothetical protein FRC04_008216 [Tulasnella sp. 424]KAG8974493.1 hypothetical protein FRC05_007292 [Tulasnella sp. 425]
MEDLFSGTAYFSPNVSRFIKKAWIKSGGLFSKKYSKTVWFFYDGPDDPDLARFSRRPILRHDCRWIMDSRRSGYLQDLAAYLLTPLREKYSSSSPQSGTATLVDTDTSYTKDFDDFSHHRQTARSVSKEDDIEEDGLIPRYLTPPGILDEDDSDRDLIPRYVSPPPQIGIVSDMRKADSQAFARSHTSLGSSINATLYQNYSHEETFSQSEPTDADGTGKREIMEDHAQTFRQVNFPLLGR